MKIKNKLRGKNNSGSFKKAASTEIKQQQKPKICKKQLKPVELHWVPNVQPLGKLLEDRYFVLKKLEKANCWLSWDMQAKCEVPIKSVIKPCYMNVHSKDDFSFETLDLMLGNKPKKMQEKKGILGNNNVDSKPTKMKDKPEKMQVDSNLTKEDTPMDQNNETEGDTSMNVDSITNLPNDMANEIITFEKDLVLEMVNNPVDTSDNCETSVVSQGKTFMYVNSITNLPNDMANNIITFQKDPILEMVNNPVDTSDNCETSVVSQGETFMNVDSITNLPNDMANNITTFQKDPILEMVNNPVDTSDNCETSVVSQGESSMNVDSITNLPNDMANNITTFQKDPILEMVNNPVDTSDNCETSVVSQGESSMNVDSITNFPNDMANKTITFEQDLVLEMVNNPVDTSDNCETSVVSQGESSMNVDSITNLPNDMANNIITFQKDPILEMVNNPVDTSDNCETVVSQGESSMNVDSITNFPNDMANKTITFQDLILEMVNKPPDTSDNCETSVVSQPSEMGLINNNWLDKLPHESADTSVKPQDDQSWASSVISKFYLNSDDFINNTSFKMPNEPINIDEEHYLQIAEQELAIQSPKMAINPVSNEPPNTQNETEMEACHDWDIFDIDLNQNSADKRFNSDSEINCQVDKDFVPSKIENGDLLNDRYFVMVQLYDGILSTVLRCWDLDSKREVVVKIPRENKNNLDMVAREIQMLTDLHSNRQPDPRKEHVIKIYHSFDMETSVGPAPCMVMELLDGTLLDLLKKSEHDSLPLSIVKNITRQMLMGMDYVHSYNIIHTDIKPENVLYSIGNGSLEDLRVKIADLGNSCYVGRPLNSEIQTPAYRCIEAILDIGYSTSADIWSVACVSFELATGKYLFGLPEENVSNRDEFHVASIIEHLRYIPLHLIMKGKKSGLIFDDYGQMLNMSDHRDSIRNVLLDTYRWSPDDAKTFAAFLEYLLELDPDKRPTAAQCLEHPWLN